MGLAAEVSTQNFLLFQAMRGIVMRGIVVWTAIAVVRLAVESVSQPELGLPGEILDAIKPELETWRYLGENQWQQATAGGLCPTVVGSTLPHWVLFGCLIASLDACSGSAAVPQLCDAPRQKQHLPHTTEVSPC